MWNPFLRKASVENLRRHTNAAIAEFKDIVGSDMMVDASTFAALPVAAVLEGLSMLAQRRTHSAVEAYREAANGFLGNETSIAAVDKFLVAFGEDLNRISAPYWTPHVLADIIIADVFPENNDEVFAKAHLLAIAFFRVAGQVTTRYKRL